MFSFLKKNVIKINCINNLYAEIFLKKEKTVKYEPGQFLIFNLKINGKKYSRAYSLSNDPEKDGYLRFIVKRVKDGVISNYIIDNSKKIKNIDVTGPFGEFTINHNFKNHIFIAGGSGITPSASILNGYLSKNQDHNFFLLYGNKNKNEVILDKELKQLSDKFSNLRIISFTDDGSYNSDGIPSAKGILDVETIKNFIKNNVDKQNSFFYVCGPEIVINNCVNIFNDFSIAKEQFKIEKFISLDNFSNDLGVKKFSLKILKENEEFTIEADANKTILENCLSKDIPINFSCMSGICTHCKVTVEDRNLVDFDDKFKSLSDEDKLKGVVLSCCSKLKNNNKITIEK